MKKKCKTCKEQKKESDFYKTNGGRTLNTECKVCMRKRYMKKRNDNASMDWHKLFIG